MVLLFPSKQFYSAVPSSPRWSVTGMMKIVLVIATGTGLVSAQVEAIGLSLATTS
jgi:hypothetical protein